MQTFKIEFKELELNNSPFELCVEANNVKDAEIKAISQLTVEFRQLIKEIIDCMKRTRGNESNVIKKLECIHEMVKLLGFYIKAINQLEQKQNGTN